MQRLLLAILCYFLSSVIKAQTFLPVDLVFEKLPVHSIVVDENNVKWIGTEKGVFSLEEVTEEAKVDAQNILSKSSISCVEKLGTRGICFVSYDNQAVWRSATKEERIHFDFLKKHLVSGLALRDQNMYIASRGGGLWKRNENRAFEKIAFKENYLNDVCLFKNQLWLATDKGLYVERKKEKFKQLSSFGKATLLYTHQEKIYAVGFGKDGKAMLQSSIDGKKWNKQALPEAFEYQAPQAIALDSEGGIWIAADRVAHLRSGNKWREFGKAQGFLSTSALSMTIDKNDNVWVGTEGKGLFVYVIKPTSVTEYKESEGNPTVVQTESTAVPKQSSEEETMDKKPTEEMPKETAIASKDISLQNAADTDNLSGKRIRLSVQFKTATADILPSYREELDKLAALLSQKATLKILVTGHTAPLGNPQKNQALSEKRAQQVKRYLLKKGIQERRIQTKGLGGAEPITTELQEMQINRRVEIIFL